MKARSIGRPPRSAATSRVAKYSSLVMGWIEDLGPKGAVTFGSLNISEGTLTGPATVTVTGATNWSGGTISDGVTNLQGATTLTGNLTLITQPLNNFGTVTKALADRVEQALYLDVTVAVPGLVQVGVQEIADPMRRRPQTLHALAASLRGARGRRQRERAPQETLDVLVQ